MTCLECETKVIGEVDQAIQEQETEKLHMASTLETFQAPSQTEKEDRLDLQLQHIQPEQTYSLERKRQDHESDPRQYQNRIGQPKNTTYEGKIWLRIVGCIFQSWG